MKTKFLILFILLTTSLLLKLNAQCLDCEESDTWRFAAGITVYSNNHYVTFQNVLERQPLEFNFRYKIGENHVLRASIPIVWKANKHGEPEESIYPKEKDLDINSLYKYLELLRDKDWSYAKFNKPIHYYESLYGISIGYDYEFPIWKSASIFGGINTAYYYSAVSSKYYKLYYDSLDDDNKSNFESISLNDKTLSRSTFNVNPTLGVRYNFQRLLFEANVGYNFLRSVTGVNENNSYIYLSTGHRDNILHSGKMEPYTGKYLLYSFSIYYTF